MKYKIGDYLFDTFYFPPRDNNKAYDYGILAKISEKRGKEFVLKNEEIDSWTEEELDEQFLRMGHVLQYILRKELP